MKNKIERDIYLDNSFILFLISQGVSNLGDTFQFIAATALLIKLTGKGLSAAFGLICGPVISILFSSAAGFISDARSEKRLLVALDLLRGVVALLFISKNNEIMIYALVILLSFCDVFYNPAKRKFLTGILDKKELITGNSLLNGISGVMFIIGSLLAGIVVSRYGTNIAFFINSLSFFISAVCIASITYKKSKSSVRGRTEASFRNTMNSLYDGILYCFNSYILRRIIIIGTIISFSTTSVNIAFYPFAFDILHISNNVWGGMMSIFYGASLLAVPVCLLVRTRTEKFYKLTVPFSLLIISLIWLSYGNTYKLSNIMLLQVLEGTIISFLNIMLTSHLQTCSKSNILGRVAGINDFFNNIGKILGIMCTYILLKFKEPNNVFIFFAVVVFVYGVITLLTSKTEKLEGKSMFDIKS